jgi:hypothetical protein
VLTHFSKHFCESGRKRHAKIKLLIRSAKAISLRTYKLITAVGLLNIKNKNYE